MNLKKPFSVLPVFLIACSALTAQAPPAAKSPVPAASTPDKSTVNPMVAAQSKARAKALKAHKAKPAPKFKLVDINGATKDELKTVSGITDAYADKIIAGRPYLSKAHLVTHDILTAALYDSIKKRIYAKQNLAKH